MPHHPDRARALTPTRPPAPQEALDGTVVPPLATLLTLAFPDTPFDSATTERFLGEVPVTTDPVLLRATLFAAARRVPADRLARLWALTPPRLRDVVARGLAGRPRAQAPGELPADWLSSLPSVSLATVVGRFRLPLVNPPPIAPLLLAADLDRQLVGARLLASRSVPLPSEPVWENLSPFVIPAVVRSLAAREDTPSVVWATLIRVTATRARVAPRQWGNPWRAVRDAVPTHRPELVSEFQNAVLAVQNPPGLAGLTLAWWNCDNAAAHDVLVGFLALTLHCAPAGYDWVGRVAQARVLGSRTSEPARRAEALWAVLQASGGHPQVLSAVASAATGLPASVAVRLIRRLARERDPAVLASLLEGLADHPEHVRSLAPAVREDLLRAPFGQPEGPSLEARIQAVRVALKVHNTEVLAFAARSRVRALRMAAAPDAGLAVEIPPPLVPPPEPARLRFVTEAGNFEMDVRPEHAPTAVRQILAAVRQHRYDGLTFHRVVPGFVVQGGDPRGDGYGGTEEVVPTELSLQQFVRGAVGVPLAGLDTGGIQLFIVTADAPHLDGRYPWVGSVCRGMETIDGLLPGDRIERVEILSPED